MPGLLDLFTGGSDPAQQQGLLAAAAQILQASGPSRMPTSFGQIVGQGLGAYQQGQQGAQDRQQQQALYGLKMRELQGELDDKDKARQDALAAQDWIRAHNTPSQPDATAPARAVLGNDMAPTVANAAKLDSAWGRSAPPSAAQPAVTDAYTQRMNMAQAMRASGIPSLVLQANALEEHALKFKPEFSQAPQVGRDTNGNLVNYVLDKDGNPKIIAGLGVKPEMTEVDLGGAKQFVDKNRVTPGQTFAKTMTFADRQSAARLAFDKEQASGNQDAVMDPLAVRMTAQQYLAGDASALQNFGRGAQGAANLNAVRLEIAKQANAAGLNGADIAAKMAEFGGTKAGQRTAATRSAGIEIAANEVAQLAPLALDASSKVARSSLLPFGKAQVMFDANTNDPNLRQFAMANTALANAYGQAMARGGVASVADKEHAKDLLGTAMDQPSYAAAVSQLQQEIKAAQAAPKAVRAELSSGVTGRGTEHAPPAASQKFDMLPAAAQFPGKRMRADNGTVYRSDGTKWIKE
jgi:hypothetical protein